MKVKFRCWKDWAVREKAGYVHRFHRANGLHHLVYRSIDNAIDEALAGYCTEIVVDILEGGDYRVVDSGRGIPTGIHPKEGIFCGDSGLYHSPRGRQIWRQRISRYPADCNGVGASVVNALSESLDLTVENGEHIFFQHFERGHYKEELKIIGGYQKTGTTVVFKPDPEIFEDPHL